MGSVFSPEHFGGRDTLYESCILTSALKFDTAVRTLDYLPKEDLKKNGPRYWLSSGSKE